MNIFDFYKNKKVLVTGHTGFKGSWMCLLLKYLGASVIGFSLDIPTTPSMFELCNIKDSIKHYDGDIRNLDCLKEVFLQEKPEIVIHMAAQPIVRYSYKEPVYTFDVNVMGTVNVLECVRITESVKSFVNVTTDKVYLNRELNVPFKEDEMLCGFDPYSNSKSCSELVTYSYKNSFFGGDTGLMPDGRKVAISTCRAGNVIGGGDFALDRIIPDCIRAVQKGEDIIVRNPYSTRPYQHVLEPVTAYLIVAMEQSKDITKAGNYNIGPEECDCINTGDLVNMFCEKWNLNVSNEIHEAKRVDKFDGGPHEAAFLKLDSTKVHSIFGFKNVWHINEVMNKIVEWNINYVQKKNVTECTQNQIKEFMKNLQCI